LADCLRSIAEQDYPAELTEIIVADGASCDCSRSVVERFERESGRGVHWIENPGLSAPCGFNAALQSASGEVLIILGVRALPAKDFVSTSIAALDRSGADAVGGVVSARGAGLQGQAIALALASRFGVGGASYRYASSPGDTDTLNYGAYRRAVFEELGGFDERMENVEDDEFNYRLRAAGKRLYLDPSIRVSYRVRPSLFALFRQYVRYGYPKARVLRRHPRQMRPRQFIPALLVLTLCSGLALAPFSSIGRRLLTMTAVAYAGASLSASLSIARGRGWRYLALLPLAFAAMHLGYGWASLLGTVRFLLIPALTGRPDPSAVPLVSNRSAIVESDQT
jgi:succinoglycan biosynthesis protein ExoA